MMTVFDQVLADPEAFRQEMLRLPFQDVPTEAGVFHGMARCKSPLFSSWITAHFPTLRPTDSLVRRSPEGQQEPNFIHTDRDMGDWTAILYLTPDPPDGDGTDFWQHTPTGRLESTAATDEEFSQELQSWRDLWQWERVGHVSAKFNRALLFSATHFHSRAMYHNYGFGDGARLTHVVFGQGVLTCST